MALSTLARLGLLPLLALAACVPPAAPPPTPAAPAPGPAPSPPLPAVGWRDQPLTPGNWAYLTDAGGSSALFGQAGAEADFILRCEAGAKRVLLSRPGTAPTALRISTTSQQKDYAAAPLAGAPPRIGVALAAADPMLDAIAFSKGRFAVIAAGLPPLVLPAWGEPIRVVEDCRG